jgi:hypothetical protein
VQYFLEHIVAHIIHYGLPKPVGPIAKPKSEYTLCQQQPKLKYAYPYQPLQHIVAYILIYRHLDKVRPQG